MIEIVNPGLLLTLQDGGRPGFAHLGVPRSGAADLEALHDCNWLVGNDRGQGALETTLVGAEMSFRQAATVAVTGADAELRIDGEEVPFGVAIEINAGSSLRIGPARSCVRSYVAVRGGLGTQPVLGSASADLLTGLGTPPLGRGDRLAIANRPVEQAPEARVAPVERPETIDLDAGPQSEERHGRRILDALLDRQWQVRPDSNRVGSRLAAVDGRLDVPNDFVLEHSQPLLPGAVQIPPGGEPIVLLRDHPVTGGYPVVGVVAPCALDACARLRPGDSFRFRLEVDRS